MSDVGRLMSDMRRLISDMFDVILRLLSDVSFRRLVSDTFDGICLISDVWCETRLMSYV